MALADESGCLRTSELFLSILDKNRIDLNLGSDMAIGHLEATIEKQWGVLAHQQVLTLN